MIQGNNVILKTLRKVLESYLLVPVIFLYAFICWYFDKSLMTVAGLSLVAVLVLLFCKNINNIYAPLIYVSFFIKNIAVEGTNWIGYLICISFAVIGFIAYTVYTVVTKKGEVKKGAMFYPIIVSSVAFLLGGVIGRFNLGNTVVIFFFCVATLMLYFLARNGTENFGKYLAYIFVVGAIFIMAEICVNTYKVMGGFTNIAYWDYSFSFFSAQGVNTAAIYLVLGMIGMYALSYGKRFDYLGFLFSLVLCLGVFITYCRTGLLLAALVILALFILYTCYSKHKRVFVIIVFVALLVYDLIWIFDEQIFLNILNALLFKNSSADGLNGRELLWPWCWDKFLKYPVFGYGFTSDGQIPTLRPFVRIILAHNTLLQWLTSLGLIGTALMSYFYIVKYKVLLKGFNRESIFFLIAALAVALSGMLDQTAAMDIFMYLVPLFISCGAEELYCKTRKAKALPQTVSG